MKKLGIIGAMSVEVETLKNKLEKLRVISCCGMDFYEGILEGLPVVVVVCGVGKVNAAMCAQILCCIFSVTHIVNTGVAGSLDAKLDIGDFVISSDAVYHDFDCHILNPDYIVGQVPGMPVRTFAADQQLLQYALQCADEVYPGHAHIGTVASGDQFVSDLKQKQAIVENTNAICTEMEGAAIAHTAYRNEVPFVIIRAISDKADDSAQMDYPAFEAAAAKRSALVTCLLARKLK